MITRLCIVDDDEPIRDSLSALFTSRDLRNRTFDDSRRFLSIWKSSELREVPSVFVIDIRMPGLSGLELLEQMKRHGLPAHNLVIFLTGHGDVPLAVEAIKAGACDFLEKPFSDNAFVDRVIAAMNAAAATMSRGDQESQSKDADIQLTPRERAIADLVVRGETNRAIAQALAISIRTVEVHRARIYEKFKVKNAVGLVQSLAAFAPNQGSAFPLAAHDHSGAALADRRGLRRSQD